MIYDSFSLIATQCAARAELTDKTWNFYQEAWDTKHFFDMCLDIAMIHNIMFEYIIRDLIKTIE